MTEIERLRQMCSEDVLALNPGLFDDAPHKQTKRSKYNSQKVCVDGMTFDSKKEYRRWIELCHLQDAGAINGLQRQMRFILQDAFTDGNGDKQRSVAYTADFVYQRDGQTVIEDCKSKITAKSESFRVRWRLLLAKFKDDPTVSCEVWIT